ncbi:hypothetical protein F5B20DRAFT_589917 [Whalleya microplaca]|nr:hypothetical protein F5B20DRAFT_589917 [Whalleya microplaca]
MAFTAVHYPTDKEQGQISYWPDNDELAMASDNFFDQFITFDAADPAALGGDLLEDPPSPSILLDSLNDDQTNSSNDHDTQPEQLQTEVLATTSFEIPSIPVTIEQSRSAPTVLTPLAEDPILSGGSISDSELLRLEGISLKSPKENVTAPSSPPSMSTASMSPRKHSRFVESVYATIRRATHRSKPHKPNGLQTGTNTAAMMDMFRRDPSSHPHELSGLNMNNFTEGRVEVKPEPIDSHGIPLSPPLTGRIPPNSNHHGNTMRFVSGHLDDPFCDGILAPPATINPARGHNSNTPMSTPILNDEAFYQHNMAMMDMNAHAYQQQPKQRSTSSAEWPVQGILTDDANQWTSSSVAYIPDGGNLPSPSWWDPSQGPIGEHHHHNDLTLHNPQADLSYEYTAEPLSGLMIHMPQPRHPQAAVLSTNFNDGLHSPRAASSHYPAPPPSTGHRHHHHGHGHGHGHGHTERRPRPRAPSSGARHHHSLTSPRKQPSSYSLHQMARRDESPSPTPRQRSSSISVRKRRSWCRREPRTPTSSSGSLGSSNGGGGGGGGGGIDFVNFTPSDKNMLMTGVAPSGSSKTKARREKEAMERRRKISEAARKAIQAAGGDPDKLVEGGFFD